MTRASKLSSGARRLTSLRVSQGFRDYVLEQLGGVPRLLPRAMFGGVGLYSDGVFFGILAADLLYFKVGSSNEASYRAAGMTPFKPFADRPGTMSYWQVPVGVMEDAGELVVWARTAIEVAKQGAQGTRLRATGSRRKPKPSSERKPPDRRKPVA